MKATLFRVMLVVVLLSAIVAVVSPSAQPAQAAGITISCSNSLVLTAGPFPNVIAENIYWVEGDGPGLPTSSQVVGSANRLQWVIAGPGDWSNLTLHWERDGTGGVSMYDLVATCEVVVPGCDVSVDLPETAVVGTITDNAAVFSEPDAAMTTDIVLTIGKTFWMDGLDASGVYRSTLISCEWVWVEAAKTGPNFDDVWQGRPLPGHTIDD